MTAKKARGPVAKPPVEVVTDPISGESVVVYYNRETGDFYADEPKLQEHIVCKDGKECVKLVLAALERARSFEWKEVIIIEHAGSSCVSHQHTRDAIYTTKGASLSFTYHRCEIAPKPGSIGRQGAGAQFVQRPHPFDIAGAYEDENDRSVEAANRDRRRVARAADRDIHDHYVKRGASVIPYTPQAWEALARLSEATLNTYAALAQLFQQPAALALAAPAPMLMPATTEKNEDPR